MPHIAASSNAASSFRSCGEDPGNFFSRAGNENDPSNLRPRRRRTLELLQPPHLRRQQPVMQRWPRLFGQRPEEVKWIPAGLC